MQRHQRARTLHAVRFVDKKAPGIDLGIDEDYKASDCFSEVKRGYQMGVIEPTTMHGFKAIRPIWVSLRVIIPSQGGITPEQWKQTATLCPLDWPTNYSLLRLWHLPTSLHQFPNLLYKQLDHRHMFTQWSGGEGRAAAGEHQTKPKTSHKTTHRSKPTNKEGARASPPDHEATKITRDAATTQNHRNQPQKQQGNEHATGSDYRRVSETRQGQGRRRGGGAVYAIRSIVSLW